MPIPQVAKATKTSTATIKRWKKDPDFLSMMHGRGVLTLGPVQVRAAERDVLEHAPCEESWVDAASLRTGATTEPADGASQGVPMAHKEHHSGTCFEWKRGRHSEKPEAFYRDVVEKVSPGPYLELFGRHGRPGWTVWGNDLTREAQIQGVVSAA